MKYDEKWSLLESLYPGEVSKQFFRTIRFDNGVIIASGRIKLVVTTDTFSDALFLNAIDEVWALHQCTTLCTTQLPDNLLEAL